MRTEPGLFGNAPLTHGELHKAANHDSQIKHRSGSSNLTAYVRWVRHVPTGWGLSKIPALPTHQRCSHRMNTLADVHLHAKWKRVPCSPSTGPLQRSAHYRSLLGSCKRLALMTRNAGNISVYARAAHAINSLTECDPHFAPARTTRTGPLAHYLHSPFKEQIADHKTGTKDDGGKKAAGGRMQSTKCPNERTNERGGSRGSNLPRNVAERPPY